MPAHEGKLVNCLQAGSTGETLHLFIKVVTLTVDLEAEDRVVIAKDTATMVVFALLIINKAGGLIYNRTFAPGLQKLDSNDYLILAGTFHGIHAISRTINPAPPVTPAPGTRRPPTTGIESMESSHFRLTCFQSPTGVKFLLFTSPEQPNTDVIVRRCYEVYGDFVMKNPFYSLEMPVRVEKFDRALGAYLARP